MHKPKISIQKNMKVIFIMMLFLFFHNTILFSTYQAPDTLIYNGVRYRLHTPITNRYFVQHPEKRPTSQNVSVSSANWRGYFATYELIDDEVWITYISIGARRNLVSEIFDGKDRAKVYWFTGRLIASYGDWAEIHESHMTVPLFENYLLIDIRNGNFVREARLTTDEFNLYLQRQFNPFDN